MYMNYTHNVNCGDFGLMHPESFLHCPTMLSNIFTIFDFFSQLLLVWLLSIIINITKLIYMYTLVLLNFSVIY